MMVLDTLSVDAMSTNFFIGLSDGTNTNWREPVKEQIRYVEKEWSRFREGNELARLNQLKVGESMKLSPLLYECMKQANDYYVKSKGLFSPYLKLQLENHGYNESFPFTKAETQGAELTVNHQVPIQFLNDCTVLKTGTQQVDLGGFAKGFLVEKIAEWLQQETDAEFGIVDGGGDLCTWSTGKKEWTIGIAHPYRREKEISYIQLKSGAVATSNRVYRSWKQGKVEKHHLLNGQTGKVAKTDVLQATVVTNSLRTAEVMTKLCFLMNDEELNDWIEQNDIQCARLMLKEDDTKYWIKGGAK
jgi:thiamine biosynthesis lipoprotein